MTNAKIFINAKIINGAWGGGNQFVRILTKYLKQHGCQITFSLKEPNIDLILMIHPKKNWRTINYGTNDIRNYIVYHPNTLLVHRVNSSSERGISPYETKVILEANQMADFTVFISSYVRDLYVSRGFDPHRPHSVILNGADESIFNPVGRVDWRANEKLRIVTHHWSSNYMKGFDIYERLDLLLGTKPFSDLFEFTIIGNIPTGLHLKHTRIIPPLSGLELSQSLKQNHIYLTASRNEPAGMHHIEGMRCGLPVVYLNSGALPEYCSPYGIEFTLIDFEKRLFEMRKRYPKLRQKVINCRYTGSWMSTQYETLFKKLILQRRNNPVPPPSIKTLLEHRLITGSTIRVRKYLKLLQNVKQYLDGNWKFQ